MAHRKAGGSAKNLKDSNPKYLGTKKYDGQAVNAGNIIIRQRGSKILSGTGTKMGKDHTIFALVPGKVKFGSKRKVGYDGQKSIKKIVTVI